MTEALPEENDVIIYGTGMTESILAGALGRIGMSVLHIDKNDYYGGDWASFNLKSLIEWSEANKEDSNEVLVVKETDSNIVKIPKESKNIHSIETLCSYEDSKIKEILKSSESKFCKSWKSPLVDSKTDNTMLNVIPLNEPTDSDMVTQNINLENTFSIENNITNTNIQTEDQVRSISSETIIAEKHIDMVDSTNLNSFETLVPDNHNRIEDSKNPISVEANAENVSMHISNISKPSNNSENISSNQQINSDNNLQNNHLIIPLKSDPVVPDKDIRIDTFNTPCLADNLLTKDVPKELEDGLTGDAAGEFVSLQSDSNCSKNSSSEDSGHGFDRFKYMIENWRKFSIDLFPKILYSRGAMVELLISSDVARYCEFKSVTRTLSRVDGRFQKVPCSRADVFASDKLSILEKRILMKFLTFAIDFENHPEEYIDSKEIRFSDYLEKRGLNTILSHYVQYSIAMVSKTATTLQGLIATKKFLVSLNRYGNLPFLWPMYGSGEMLQCFCRLCAVFGGVYCLRHELKEFVTDQSNEIVEVVDYKEQHIKTKWLVVESKSVPRKYLDLSSKTKKISRAIILTNESLFSDEEHHISLAIIPSKINDENIIMYELSSSSSACPNDIYVVHLTCSGVNSAKDDFAHLIEEIFQPISTTNNDMEDDDRPQILWSLFFSYEEYTPITDTTTPNLLIVPGPDLNLDCDTSIEIARQLFFKICPDSEFLPKAPNPEDIIFSNDQETQDHAIIDPSVISYDNAVTDQDISIAPKIVTDQDPTNS